MTTQEKTKGGTTGGRVAVRRSRVSLRTEQRSVDCSSSKMKVRWGPCVSLRTSTPQESMSYSCEKLRKQ